MRSLLALWLCLFVGAAFAQASHPGPALPLAVANGGTGDTGTAWTAYTPTIVCGAGTNVGITAAGRYKTIGKTVFIEVSAIVTSTTCGSTITLSIAPGTTAGSIAIFVGKEIAVTGNAQVGFLNAGSTALLLTTYLGTTSVQNSAQLFFSGVYEST